MTQNNATEPTERNISRLTANTLAIVLAGGKGSRLKALTEWRAKPAVPFGGKFRIIDFPLSNCINSGIRKVSVATQYKSHSLQRHIQRGWSFLSGQFNEFVEVIRGGISAAILCGDGRRQGTQDERRGAGSDEDATCDGVDGRQHGGAPFGSRPRGRR